MHQEQPPSRGQRSWAGTRAGRPWIGRPGPHLQGRVEWTIWRWHAVDACSQVCAQGTCRGAHRVWVEYRDPPCGSAPIGQTPESRAAPSSRPPQAGRQRAAGCTGWTQQGLIRHGMSTAGVCDSASERDTLGARGIACTARSGYVPTGSNHTTPSDRVRSHTIEEPGVHTVG